MTNDSPLVDWAIDLQGEPNILAQWASKFATGREYRVEREQADNQPPRYYLRSPKFEGLRDTEIHMTARQLVELMNGLMGVWYYTKPVSMGMPMSIRADGSRISMQLLEASAQISLEALATLTTSGTGGAPGAAGMEIPPMASLMALAEGNAEVADALRYFSEPDDWIAFYKLYEVIRYALGCDDAFLDKGWVSEKRLTTLKRTANFYRHAREDLPPNPMAISAARAHLRTVMQRWLLELHNSGTGR